MISLQGFYKQLKAAKLPLYSYPKFEPGELFEHYSFQTLVGTRKLFTPRGSRAVQHTETYHIDKKIQQRMLLKVLRMPEIVPYTIAISSSVNDYLAHEVACTVLLGLIRNCRSSVPIQWTAVTPKFEPTAETKRQQIVIVRNIIPSHERIYQIRDILDHYYNSLRIVVLGGTDGIDFFDNYLYYPLNGCVHINGYKGVIPKDFWVRDEMNEMLNNEEYRYPVFTVDKVGKTILENFKIRESEEL